MLTVLTHVCDVTTAGIFTIAYANANLFLNLGKYSVRNFQVSDVHEKYDFAPYHAARILSVLAMIVCGAAWALWSAFTVGYTLDKTLIVLMMLIFKAIDAYEDVFHGDYQQHGRLDVGAKMLTFRMITMIVLYAGLVIFTRNLLLALTATTIFTGLFFIGETIWAKRSFQLPTGCIRLSSKGDLGKKSFELLRECFPVFLASFLLFYIGNAPKYAIDAVMDDAAQAYYGYIAMPVFVVGLLANFIYNPIIASLSEDWAEGQSRKFGRRFTLQVLIIVGITILCVVAAWLLGVPVLDLLYNANLSPYKVDLAVLLIGGGFLAAATLFTTGLTIIRWQNKLIPGYVVISIAALALCRPAVQAGGIHGAAWIYLGLMAVLALWFGIVFACGVKAGSQKLGNASYDLPICLCKIFAHKRYIEIKQSAWSLANYPLLEQATFIGRGITISLIHTSSNITQTASLSIREHCFSKCSIP